MTYKHFCLQPLAVLQNYAGQKGNSLVRIEENYSAGILKILIIHWLCQYFKFALKKSYGCLARQQKVTIVASSSTLTAKQTELPFCC